MLPAVELDGERVGQGGSGPTGGLQAHDSEQSADGHEAKDAALPYSNCQALLCARRWL